MSVSTTRRLALGLTILILAGCSGPKPLDTGASVIEVGRELTHTLWQKDLGRSLEFPPVWFENSWLAAPTEGALWRLDAETGTVIWKTKLPASPTASPLIAGKMVIMTSDAPAGEVMGFRVETGEEVWKWGRAITLPAVRDTVVVLAARGGKVVRLDPETGEARWTARLQGAGWRAPILMENAVVVPGRPDSLVAFGLDDGERRWGRMVGPWPCAAEHEGILAVATDDSAVVILDPETGEVRSRKHLSSMVAGPPRIAQGHLILALRTGVVEALETDSLTTVWTCALESPLVTAPFVHRGRVLQAGPRGLVYSIDPGTGEILGVYRHPEPLVSSPRAEGTTLAVGGDHGTLVVYRRDP